MRCYEAVNTLCPPFLLHVVMKNSQESATPDLVTEHLGVWQVVHYRLPTSFKFPGQQALARWKVVFNNAAAHIIPFLRDIQDALGTKLFMLYVLCRIWSSIEDAVLLYLLGGILAEVRHLLHPRRDSDTAFFLVSPGRSSFHQ